MLRNCNIIYNNFDEKKSQNFAWWAVREHGCSWEEAEGDGDFLRAINSGGGWDPCWSTLLPWPWWLHGGDMRLWQPPRDSISGRDGSILLAPKPSDGAASAADPSDSTIRNEIC